MDVPHTSPFRSPLAWICLLVPLAIGLSSDLYTKYLAEERLKIDRVEDVDGTVYIDARVHQAIPDYLHFTYHENRGAVFGIGQGARTLFLLVSALAIGLLAYLFSRSGNQWAYQILLGMLLAGVLGNLYDRAVYGYVRDMIHVFPKAGIFPWIFNIADSLLCTGVGGMFVFTIFRREDPMSAPQRSTRPADPEAAQSE
jgi:lipoprotein signal peptidase